MVEIRTEEVDERLHCYSDKNNALSNTFWHHLAESLGQFPLNVILKIQLWSLI